MIIIMIANIIMLLLGNIYRHKKKNYNGSALRKVLSAVRR